jgi:hypothetical protein
MKHTTQLAWAAILEDEKDESEADDDDDLLAQRGFTTETLDR